MADRATLLSEIEPYRSAWDRRHLAATLEEATAECSDLDLDLMREMVRCYHFYDLPALCPGGEAECYGELTPECSRIDSMSAECVSRYTGFLSDDDPIERDCTQGMTGVALAQMSLTRDQIPELLPSEYTLIQSFESGEGFAFLATSEEDGQTACHVVFKGISSTDSALTYAQDISLVDCMVDTDQNLGQCDATALGVYQGLHEMLLIDSLRAAVDDGSCSAGVFAYGHNLGGALASLLAAELVNEDPGTFGGGYLQVITYGEPQIFDATTTDALEALVPKTRWTTWGDPVVAGGTGGHFGLPIELYYPYGKRNRELVTAFTETNPDFVPWGSDLTQHSLADGYLEKLSFCQ